MSIVPIKYDPYLLFINSTIIDFAEVDILETSFVSVLFIQIICFLRSFKRIHVSVIPK